MLPPPPQGSPFDLLPPGIATPEAWGNVIAWDAFRTFGGQVLDQAMADMQVLGGIPA
jgi:hypothetical protein